MYLLAIAIVILNYFVTPNDSNYVPKSKRTKVHTWIKRVHKATMTIVANMAAKVEDRIMQVLSSTDLQRKKSRGVKQMFPRKRAKWHTLALSATAMTAKTKIRSNVITFDSDSAPVGIDNRCLACIGHIPEDFIGDLVDTDRTIRGFAGTKISRVKIGTLRWSWLDDQGIEHTFNIPKSYFVPQGKVRLLSPQHWAKYNESTVKGQRYKGTLSQTTSSDVTLIWNERKTKLTVPLSKENNVATFYLAPSFNKYFAFCAEAELDKDQSYTNPLMCQMTQDEVTEEVVTEFDGKWTHQPQTTVFHDATSDRDTLQDSEGATGRDEIQRTTMAAFLQLHQQMGYIPFQKMKVMAQKSVIPHRFARCPIPVCASCTYVKLTKKAWRGKPEKNYQKNSIAKEPGDIISIDQLVSPTPGLVAQMTGHLTTQRYKYATVFVDQVSKYGYVHIQKTASAEETVKAKLCFENHLQSMGIKVKSYHADSGILRAHKWIQACKVKQQEISFVGVNAHHQNGHAERRIRELQGAARTNILHTISRWPTGVTANLWPYALRMASDTFNNSPNLQSSFKLSPMQMVSKSMVDINPKHFHTFGCPAYVLNSDLQQNKPFGKWKSRAEVGIYLGLSPHHNRNVGMILSRSTGLVSPQFHIKYDNNFDTVNEITTVEDWKFKAGFVRQKIADDKVNRNEYNHTTPSNTTLWKHNGADTKTNPEKLDGDVVVYDHKITDRRTLKGLYNLL